ncbi:MAG: hypothetical protein Q8J66_11825, partial [Methylotenera sp.]|nr:hypothetical protein [Methylotenera sp.]
TISRELARDLATESGYGHTSRRTSQSLAVPQGLQACGGRCPVWHCRWASQEEALLIATVHNGFSFTSKFVNSLNRNVATIVADPDYVKNVTFKRTGISSNITVIKRDKFCLAKLLESVRNHYVICCDIDFQKALMKKLSTSAQPYSFFPKKKNNLPIYFAKYEISCVGDLQISFQESASDVEPIDALTHFISFINSTREVKRELLPSKF